MTPAARIATFATVVAAVFVAATLAGAALEPSFEEPQPAHTEEDEMEIGQSHGKDGAARDALRSDAHTGGHSGGAVAGLAAAEAGYRLLPEHTTLPAGAGTYRFTIADADGHPVRDFEVEHERRMHLIVVRRDFTGFQHLHPRQAGDGAWETALTLPSAGTYRVFADFATGRESLTLASDLFVAGQFDPEPLPAPATTADAGDGYEVRLASAPPVAGKTTDARFTVTRDGRELAGVEPYLGADGHLVALRQHDQAFLHTHPEGKPGGSGTIRFAVEYPTAGQYRLYLQFKHGGKVRTAEFTQKAGSAHAEDDHGE